MWHYLFGIKLFNTQGGFAVCFCFGIFFFTLQLLLCLLIRRRRFGWTKLLPVIFLVTEWFDMLAAAKYEGRGFQYSMGAFPYGEYYLVSVPASVLIDMFYASCTGVLCAVIAYVMIRGIKRIVRKRKLNKTAACTTEARG